jgi:hypothetical protein
MSLVIHNDPLTGIAQALNKYTELSITIKLVFVGSGSLGTAIATTVKNNETTLFVNAGLPMAEIVGHVVSTVSKLVAEDIDGSVIEVRDHIWGSLVPTALDNMNATTALLSVHTPPRHLHS